MKTSRIRANRRRLANKLRALQGEFETTSQIIDNEFQSLNVFSLMQGRFQRTKLAKDTKWLWFNRYYQAKKQFNAERYGRNVIGNSIKNNSHNNGGTNETL